MMISTKGKYALQTMIDLAQQAQMCACEDTECTCVSLKAIAERQNISLKFLESIAALLNRGGLIKSTRGKDGGYKLRRKPNEYTIGSILKLTEGSLAPISCAEFGSGEPGACGMAGSCITLPMWQHLDEIVDGYLERITLEDLLRGNV